MNNGIVEIHGRQYETVALRVKKFRDKCPAHTLLTKIVRLDEDEVLIEAQILDESGRIIANGHAQEFRASSQINKTSYVENCETSAIGRALAAFGLGGSEFASADEVANAIVNKPQGGSPTALNVAAFEAMDKDEQEFLRKIAANVVAMLDEKRDEEAFHYLEAQKLDEVEKPAMWSSLLDSKQRRRIKDAGNAIRERETAAERAAERSKHQESRAAA